MKTLGYWRHLIAVAFVVMVTGYWLMTAFTVPLPIWLVVLASALGVLLFVDWLGGRLQTDELSYWLRPVGLAVLTVVAYGLLTSFNFLPSSALLLAVLVPTILLDLMLGRMVSPLEEPPLPVHAATPRG
jgi:hypothetical protein